MQISPRKRIGRQSKWRLKMYLLTFYITGIQHIFPDTSYKFKAYATNTTIQFLINIFPTLRRNVGTNFHIYPDAVCFVFHYVLIKTFLDKLLSQ